MDPLLVFPESPPDQVARALDLHGTAWKSFDPGQTTATDWGDAAWSGVVIVADSDIQGILATAASIRRHFPEIPRLWVIAQSDLRRVAEHVDAHDDFCVAPLQPGELSIRLGRLTRSSADPGDPANSLIEYGPLKIDAVTYQAALDGEPLDLTYMEYELLKYFAEHPGRVCTREVLLSQVWGYDYYGGARTVDVHVRRLRAKLGEPHAGLISTVRSVGYRFGKSKWG